MLSAAALVDAEQLLLCNEIMTWFKYAAVLASATGFITSPAPAVRSVASRAAVLDRAEVQRPGPSLHLVSKSPARIPEPRRAAGPDLRRGPGQPRHRRQRRRRHGLRRAAASVDRFRSARRRAARGGGGRRRANTAAPRPAATPPPTAGAGTLDPAGQGIWHAHGSEAHHYHALAADAASHAHEGTFHEHDGVWHSH